jgi:hypothetical protein
MNVPLGEVLFEDHVAFVGSHATEPGGMYMAIAASFRDSPAADDLLVHIQFWKMWDDGSEADVVAEYHLDEDAFNRLDMALGQIKACRDGHCSCDKGAHPQ